MSAFKDDDFCPDTQPNCGSGAVYVCSENLSWTCDLKLHACDATSEDNFGNQLGAAGDTLIVGAPRHENMGAAYVFRLGVDDDPDGDQVVAACDNCLQVDNPMQSDVDLDGVGDLCDSCPNAEPPAEVAANGSLRARYEPSATEILVTYTPGCCATDHAIYYGPLEQVRSLGWDGAACGLGITGTASFVSPHDSTFFVVVGQDGNWEGSYGQGSSSVERPEAVGPWSCDLPRDLGTSCP